MIDDDLYRYLRFRVPPSDRVFELPICRDVDYIDNPHTLSKIWDAILRELPRHAVLLNKEVYAVKTDV